MYRKDICNRLIALFRDLEGVYSGEVPLGMDQSKFKLSLFPKQNGEKVICKIKMEGEGGSELILNEYSSGIVAEINKVLYNLITSIGNFEAGSLYMNTVSDFTKLESERRVNDRTYESFKLKLSYQPITNSYGKDFHTETLVTVKTRLGEWEFLI